MTDAEIINCFAENDWNTPCRFILDHSDWPSLIKRDVIHQGGSAADGQVIANEAALTFCLNLRKEAYRQEGPLRKYYQGIGKNLWLHEKRRQARYGFHLNEYHRVASTYRTEELYPEHWKEEYEHVTTALEQLNTTNQRILKLVGEKWKYKRIARKVGLASKESVATTVKKARRKLIAAVNRLSKFILISILLQWL